MLAQDAACLLIEFLYLACHLAAVNDAHGLHHAKPEALCDAAQALVVPDVEQGKKMQRDLPVDEVLEPTLNLLRNIRVGFVIDEGRHLRFQRVVAGHELADRVLSPHQPALIREVHFGIR